MKYSKKAFALLLIAALSSCKGADTPAKTSSVQTTLTVTETSAEKAQTYGTLITTTTTTVETQSETPRETSASRSEEELIAGGEDSADAPGSTDDTTSENEAPEDDGELTAEGTGETDRGGEEPHTDETDENGEPLEIETTATTEEELLVVYAPEKTIRAGLWIAKNAGENSSDIYYGFNGDGNGDIVEQETGATRGFTYEIKNENGLIDIGRTGESESFSVTYTDDDHVSFDFDGRIVDLEYFAEGFSQQIDFFSSKWLRRQALAYYGLKTGYCPSFVDSMNDPDGLVTIRLYDLAGDHGSTVEWYYIDRYTGRGTDAMGSPVDLSCVSDDFIYNPDKEQKLGGNSKLLANMREKLSARGGILGTGYLGWLDGTSLSSGGLEALLEAYGYSPLSKSSLITTPGGYELYLVVPTDENSSVVVRTLEWNGDSFEKSRLLYMDSEGDPLLILCNVSETLPDIVINITDSAGNTVEYSPALSGNDGKLVTTDGVVDMTAYKRLAEYYGLAAEEENTDTWETEAMG